MHWYVWNHLDSITALINRPNNNIHHVHVFTLARIFQVVRFFLNRLVAALWNELLAACLSMEGALLLHNLLRKVLLHVIILVSLGGLFEFGNLRFLINLV
jgi:hypothetical protein